MHTLYFDRIFKDKSVMKITVFVAARYLEVQVSQAF